MFHLFIVMENFSMHMIYIYAIFLILHVFAYTATLDGRKYALITESLKLGIGLILLAIQDFSWYGGGDIITLGLIFYLLTSLGMTYYFLIKQTSPPTTPQLV
mgnify:CR=1 FL=1